MKLTTLILASTLALTTFAASAAEELDILRQLDINGFPKPIPVQITGFSSEVKSILKFDLLFMGLAEATQENEARFVIRGKDSPGRVEGTVYDPVARNTILAKAFTGGTIRSETHALADDIATAITHKPGIAQTRIAFVVKPSGVGAGEIYIADYDGHNAQQVTRDGAIVAAPDWASRSLLFYTSYKLGNPDIFSQNLTTGARRAVAHFNGLNSSAAVSPDGTRLAMILSKSGNPELYVSDLSGNNLRQLTHAKAVVASPCWAPDSRTICYCSTQSGRKALYTISADGGSPSRMPTLGISNPTEPDWSPDGEFIIFTSQMGDFQICLVPTKGSRRGHATVLVAGEDPVWAPNSRAVIFARSINHRHVLSLLDVPTKQVKDVARISGSASQPSWGR